MLDGRQITPHKEIITHIKLDAEPYEVWTVLTDGEKYKEWNPFIIDMSGTVKEGAIIKNIMQSKPQQKMVFKPEILVAKPCEELRWRGRLLFPGIFDGEHYFLLKKDGKKTILTHGEKFSGIGLWLINVEQFRQNFEEMNYALKSRLFDLERKEPS